MAVLGNGVSVIICCYNSADRLCPTLQHLAKQRTKNVSWEIILVDNNSTDETQAVAQQQWEVRGCSDVQLRIVEEQTPGLSAARHKGIEEAKHDIIIFCDDDNWLCEEYVKVVHKLMTQHDQIGALGGTGIPVFEQKPPAWFKNVGFMAIRAQGIYEGPVKVNNLFGAGLALRKSIYRRLFACGFRPVLTDRKGTSLSSGGDLELTSIIKAIGYALWFSPRLTFQHYIPAHRIKASYLKKLRRQMGKGSCMLLPYTSLNITQKGYKQSYLYFYLVSLYLTIRYLVESLVNPMRKYDFFYYLSRVQYFPVLVSKLPKIQKDLLNTCQCYQQRV